MTLGENVEKCGKMWKWHGGMETEMEMEMAEPTKITSTES